MTTILGVLLALVGGVAIGWRHGYAKGYAAGERSAAGDLGQQMQRWKSGDVVKNRSGEPIDLAGVREKAR